VCVCVSLCTERKIESERARERESERKTEIFQAGEGAGRRQCRAQRLPPAVPEAVALQAQLCEGCALDHALRQMRRARFFGRRCFFDRLRFLFRPTLLTGLTTDAASSTAFDSSLSERSRLRSLLPPLTLAHESDRLRKQSIRPQAGEGAVVRQCPAKLPQEVIPGGSVRKAERSEGGVAGPQSTQVVLSGARRHALEP
jgi:hypothetical protein